MHQGSYFLFLYLTLGLSWRRPAGLTWAVCPCHQDTHTLLGPHQESALALHLLLTLSHRAATTAILAHSTGQQGIRACLAASAAAIPEIALQAGVAASSGLAALQAIAHRLPAMMQGLQMRHGGCPAEGASCPLRLEACKLIAPIKLPHRFASSKMNRTVVILSGTRQQL